MFPKATAFFFFFCNLVSSFYLISNEYGICLILDGVHLRERSTFDLLNVLELCMPVLTKHRTEVAEM